MTTLLDTAQLSRDERWDGSHAAMMQTDHPSVATAGLPVDQPCIALAAVHPSPVFALIRQHAATMFPLNDPLPSAASTRLAEATLDILRVLVASVAPDGRHEEATPHETTYARILAHIEANLAEPTLTPGSIAAAHHISLRQLYVVWRSCSETKLGPWIIRRRLETARDLLHCRKPLNIEAVARQVGFVNSAHFSRSFRQAFGETPTAWRRRAAENGN